MITLTTPIAEAMVAEKKVQCFTVTSRVLNIRTLPHVNSSKVGDYARGERVCGDVVEDGWLKIDNGWVSKEYLKPSA